MENNEAIKILDDMFVTEKDGHYALAERKKTNAALEIAINAIKGKNQEVTILKDRLAIRDVVHSQNHELLNLLKLAKAEFDSDIDYLPVPTQVEVSNLLTKINETINKYAD